MHFSLSTGEGRGEVPLRRGEVLPNKKSPSREGLVFFKKL